MKMTVNSIQETRDRVSDFEIQQKSKDFSSSLPKISMESGDLAGKIGAVKEFMESEIDRESGGSSEEVEESSPKSVGKWRKNNMEKIGFVHSQVLKIREEDSHLGEDIVEGLTTAKDKVINGGGLGQNLQLRRVASAVNVVFFSRPPILPCSPLSGKTTVKALP